MERGRLMRIAALLLLIALAGCSKFRSYDGPEVTRVVVFKEERRMYLMHGNRALAGYDIEMGFTPDGHKLYAGDGRTPEGRYTIDRRNPDSRFHLSLGIDYPNAADVARARASGKDPGGNIFIHGTPKGKALRADWTWGCIAVSNREMEDIYAMVANGTVIDIYATAKAVRAPAPEERRARVEEAIADAASTLVP